MKRRPLLLKFGDMPLDVTGKWGDYPAIFPRVMGMDRADFTVVDPSLDQALPEARNAERCGDQRCGTNDHRQSSMEFAHPGMA